MKRNEGEPDYKGENTAELICLNCNHKFGWHHGLNQNKTMTHCYGITCECNGFHHNFCCLEPLFKVIGDKKENTKNVNN